ncbi:uncharacterized protein [Clinocottus analis]|uniref:uncharacterized protein n=1 Tax=Clinocottus analis TaxID=304258 RepID=UPI0035C1E21A
MNFKRNERGYKYDEVENQHLKLKDLKEKTRGLRIYRYLGKEDVPALPHPEFHVTRVRHDTDQDGLRGIRRDEGFKNPGRGALLWWSPSVGKDDMESAEQRLLNASSTDRTEAQDRQSFLGKFATSPAFTGHSRLGSYRFTFPLEELLTAYSEQFCEGEPPVMRVLGTHLFAQQVMHVVLVHGPAHQEYSGHPLLPDDDPNAVCTFRDGRFIWRPEAMSGTHYYEFDENKMEARDAGPYPEFYVWDHVAVALHVGDEMLNFDAGRLRENLRFCTTDSTDPIHLGGFEDAEEAEGIVQDLWPDIASPLEEDRGIQ